MRDYLDFETTPADEPCAQVGDEDYSKWARLEVEALRAQLLRTFGEPPSGGFKRDFGSYLGLRFIFDDEDEAAGEYGYNIEGEFPQYWDNQAKEFLKQNSYPLLTNIHGASVSTPRWLQAASNREFVKLANSKKAEWIEEPLDMEIPESEYLVSKVYEVVTEESAEDGDVEDSGFVFQDEKMDESDIVGELKEGYIHPSSSSLSSLGWVSTEAEQDMLDGSYTSYSLHIRNLDGSFISEEVWEHLLDSAGILVGMHLSSTVGEPLEQSNELEPIIKDSYSADTHPYNAPGAHEASTKEPCDSCGDPLPEKRKRWHADDWSGMEYCSKECAAKAAEFNEEQQQQLDRDNDHLSSVHQACKGCSCEQDSKLVFDFPKLSEEMLGIRMAYNTITSTSDHPEIAEKEAEHNLEFCKNNPNSPKCD